MFCRKTKWTLGVINHASDRESMEDQPTNPETYLGYANEKQFKILATEL